MKQELFYLAKGPANEIGTSSAQNWQRFASFPVR